MKEFNTKTFAEQLTSPLEESTVSLLVDPDSGDELPSPDELRKMFEISDGDDCSDYGELKIIGLGGMGAVFQADAALAWLKWQLQDDKKAAKMFRGSPCGLSQRDGWTTDKNKLID